MEEFWNVWESGQPQPDILHYMPIEVHNLYILDNCLVICTADYGEYSEMILRSMDNVTYYSLRIYGAHDFRIASWTAESNGCRYLIDWKG